MAVSLLSSLLGVVPWRARGAKETITARGSESAPGERLVRIAATVPGVICSFQRWPDGTARMPYASPAAEDLWGLSPEQLAVSVLPLFERIHPEDAPGFLATIEESARSLEPWHDTFRYEHPLKGERWIEGRSMPQLEPDGSVLWHGFVMDVTDRRTAERAMRESEERFRTLFETTALGVVHQDASGRIIDANPAAERILGLTREELLGRSSVDPRWRTVREDGSPLPGQEHPAMVALRSGRAVPAVTFGVFDPRANQLRWILVDATPVFRPGDGAPWQVFTTFADVTESRRAQRALAESEQKLRLFIENAPAAIAMLNRELRYMAASRRWLTDYRLCLEDVLGRTHYEVFPEIPERWKAIHRRCLSGATESCDEDPFLRADGQLEWVKWEIRPWHLADGTVGGIIIATERITERKRAQEALRASEDFKRSVLDSVAAHIAVLDEHGVIVETNEPWRRFAAGAPGTDEGVNYLEVCEHSRGEGAEDAAAAASGIREVLEGRAPSFSLEYPCPTNSGTRWFSLLATPMGSGRKGVVVAHQDFTERRRAEHAAAIQKEALEMVASGAPMGRTLEVLARSIESREPGLLASILLVADDGARLCHGAAPSLPDAYVAAVDGVGIGEGMGSCGTAAWRREPVFVEDIATDPLWRDFRELALAHGLRACWSTPILDAAGRVLGTFALYYRSPALPSAHHLRLIQIATHAAAIAIVRAREEQALRESEKRFHDIVEASADWVWEVDPQGRYTYASDSVRSALGYSPAEVLGRTPFDFMEPEEEARVRAEFAAIVAARRPFRDLDNLNRHRDGSLRYVQTNGTPILSAAGELLGYRGIDRDVTARVQADLARERLQAQLAQSQKMESVGRLAGGVAHDFNNMLGVILGHAEMAQRRLSAEAAVQRDLLEIAQAARRSAELTRQLLAFARRQPVRLRVLDLNEALAGMLAMLRRLIGEEIELVFRPGPELWKVRIDPSQVDQAIANLVVNARDAIAGVGRIEIETGNVHLEPGDLVDQAGASPGDFVRLTVSDSGCGMDEATLAHVFEPFFTTKAEGKGTGLGLATVYGIVKQNGGLIEVHSSPGGGARFRIFLGRTEAEAEVEAAPLAVSARRGGETVLVVEDEPSLLSIVRETLEAAGYAVLAAGSAEEALGLARAHAGPIHLLLTDVVMPAMNGRQLADALCASRPELRRLFSSGYTADLIAHHGVLDEGVVFLQKPYSARELASRVREALDA